jgi:hypothetical protein
LNGLAKKYLIFPTIKLELTKVEQYKVDLEVVVGCMDGMKDDIEKVGDSTFNVVQDALKAKNNGLKKEERVGALPDFIQVHVGAVHIDSKVDCTKV